MPRNMGGHVRPSVAGGQGHAGVDVGQRILRAMLRRAALCLPLLLAACGAEGNRWQGPAPTADATVSTTAQAAKHERIVLFAPLALGPLEKIYADGRILLPHRMASYMDVLVRNADGMVGEMLPDSGADDWKKGRVAATIGADLVVLTRVLDLRRASGVPDSRGANERQIAEVAVRGLDASGRTVLDQTVTGEVVIEAHPKLGGGANESESRAVWQALSTICGLVKDHLDGTGQAPPALIPRQEALAGGPTIDVTIDSDPPKADILIDGQFRGTTPQIIPLPAKPVSVRIERGGFQPWSSPRICGSPPTPFQ